MSLKPDNKNVVNVVKKFKSEQNKRTKLNFNSCYILVSQTLLKPLFSGFDPVEFVA